MATIPVTSGSQQNMMIPNFTPAQPMNRPNQVINMPVNPDKVAEIESNDYSSDSDTLENEHKIERNMRKVIKSLEGLTANVVNNKINGARIIEQLLD